MKKAIWILFFGLSAITTGCGSGSNSSSTSNNNASDFNTGVFIDAPVKGVQFSTSDSKLEGTTNEKGEFQYKTGDQVTFSFGDIELGKGLPDDSKQVKVTQLNNAILVAQLLQTLDMDTDTNKIDVSEIMIPDDIKRAIKTKLEGRKSTDDILSQEQLDQIKARNPKKRHRFPTNPITRKKVLDHIEQQLGQSGLNFREEDVKNKIFISASMLTAIHDTDNNRLMNDRIVMFNGNNKKAYSVERKSDTDDTHHPLASYFEIPSWDIQNGLLTFGGTSCQLKKLHEDRLSIDVMNVCTDNSKSEIGRFAKARPLSIHDFAGKTAQYYDTANSDPTTLTFTQHPQYENALLKGTSLVFLVHGTLKRGVGIMLDFDSSDAFSGIVFLRTSSTTNGYAFHKIKNIVPPATNNPDTPPPTPAPFTATSQDFKSGQSLGMDSVASHCGGNNKSPDIAWSNPPTGTQSFAVTVFDPDGGNWWHWSVYNIPSNVTSLAKNASADAALPAGSLEANNSWGNPSFGGACPPSGTHRYQLTVYALDKTLSFSGTPTATQVKTAIDAAKLGSVMIESTYRR